MLWLALLLVGIPCLLLWDYLCRKGRNDMLHYMPGPATLPFLGNVLLYRGIDGEHIMEHTLANCRKYGRMYRIWAFYQLAIFATDPRDVQFVLSSPQLITKNNLYNLLRPWLGTGLLMSTGSKWRARRKIITPTFHFKILEGFVDIFDQQSSILVLQLQQHADGRTPLNIFPFIFLAALDIIAETAMGTKVNAQKNPHLPYVQAVYELTSIMTDRFIKPWQRNEWIFRLMQPTLAKKQDALISIMHEFTECIIKQRREALVKDQQQQEQQLKSGDESNVPGQKRRWALLDVLLQATTLNGAPLSDEDIREEVDTFMFEGHDTTTSGISFCLYEISRHAAVQKRLIDEIDEVLDGDRQRAMTLHDLNELKYLECVIKEALRLYPPVPIIARTFSEDVQIRGKRIPAGTDFFVGIFVLLRDACEFQAPNEFRPQRFASDVDTTQSPTHQLHPYANVPFSAGPHNCIGQKFAMLEMKCTICRLLQRFELLPLGPQPRPMLSLVLRSVNGVHLGLRPRLDK